MLKKAKLYSLLALIVASTVVGLFGFTSTANAQTPNPQDQGFASDSITKSFKDKTYIKVMEQCTYSVSTYGMSEDDLQGSWGVSTDLRVGYIIDNDDDGKIGCAGEWDDIVTGYKAAINYKPLHSGSNLNADQIHENNIHLACTVGFRPIVANAGPGMSINDCVAASKNADTIYQLPEATILELAEGFATDPYSDAEKYLTYRHSLFHACGYEVIDFTSDDGASTSDVYSVPIVYQSGEPRMVDYKLTNPDQPVAVYFLNSEGAGTKPNENRLCKELPGLMMDTYKKYNPTAGDTDSSNEGDGTGTGVVDNSTCRVDGIGWIICPVVNLMAEMVDSSYYLLDNSLLRTPAISLDTDAPLYEAWKLMRDFANVAFVLIFMFIIFSQITSFGISNYGIKQLLPKLIIAAILVNLSYLICALAVDASNIIGSQLKGFFDNLASDIDTGGSSGPFGWKEADDGGGVKSGVVGWGALAGIILVSASLGGGVLAILALLIPFLFAALGAVIATVLTLIIRQALIIVLIFIAPLAFVALLLPNTESYFKSWRKLFQSLLLLYPIIALVFGGSALASRIIMAAAEAATQGDPLGEDLGGMTQTLLQLSGAAVSVVPLFLVPTVIKVAGGALNRFAGIVNNPNKGPIDWARNRSMKGVERMQKNQASKALERRAEELKNPVKKGRVALARGRAGDFLSGNSKYYRDADIKQEDTNRDRELALQEANYNTSQALAQADLTGKADGRKVREVATAVKQRDELKEKELQATIAVLDEIGLKGAANQELAMTGAVEFNGKSYKGEALQEAAAIRGFRVGGMSEKMQILEATGKDSGNEVLQGSRSRIVDEAIKTGVPKLAPQYASKNLDLLTQGDFEHDRDAVKNIKAGQFKSAGVASGHSYAFNRAVDAAIKANDVEAMDILKDVVDGIESNKNLIGEVRGDKEMLKTMDKVKRWQPQSPSTTQQSSQPQQQPAPTTTPQQPAVPPTSTSTPSPSNAGGATAAAPSSPSSAATPPVSDNWGSRQRDWSGYGQPVDTGMPTQTESPTFTPGQSSTPAAPTPSTINEGRQRDWSGYDQSSNATADAMEKVAKELKNTASQMDENNSYGTVERVKEAVSSTTAQTMQQFYDNQPASTPASPTPPSAPPTINGGRQRDWSGYGQSTPADTGMPTQTESPTFRPGSNNLK